MSLTFKIHERILCHKEGDPENTYREARVLDKRISESDEDEYYVTYLEYNKRLDEWVKKNRMIKFTHKEQIIRPTKKVEGQITRKMTRAMRQRNISMLEKENENQTNTTENDVLQRTKNIENITIGKYDIKTWYFSPYPGKYGISERLFICDKCLKYMNEEKLYIRHLNKCNYHFPPGLLIYKDDERKLAFFEIDGAEAKLYCQSLCLLSKLFLDHKTLYYDVEPFYFYVLCEFTFNERIQQDEYVVVGYFSKEKASPDGFNLSCLMVLPHHQRKGYGKMLISMSYELSKIEGVPGSPEKPLSDLGLVSFKSYWKNVIINELVTSYEIPSVHELMLKTGIIKEDCVSTLETLGCIEFARGAQYIVIKEEKMAELRELNTHRKILVKKELIQWKPHSVVVKYQNIMDLLKIYC